MRPEFPLSPRFQIELDAQTLEPAMAASVEALELHQALNAPARLILRVRDPEERWQRALGHGCFSHSGDQESSRHSDGLGDGLRMVLRLEEGQELFSGLLTCLDAQMTPLQALRLRIEARDELCLLAQSFSHRLHKEGSDLRLAQSFARRLRLSFSPSCAPVATPSLLQDGGSDLSFLRELARLVGRDFLGWQGKLLWLDLSPSSGATGLGQGSSLPAHESGALRLRWGEGLERVSLRMERESLPLGVVVSGSEALSGTRFQRASSPSSRASLSSSTSNPSSSSLKLSDSSNSSNSSSPLSLSKPSRLSNHPNLSAFPQSGSQLGSRSGSAAPAKEGAAAWLRDGSWREVAEAWVPGFSRAAEVELERRRRRSEILSAELRQQPVLRPGLEVELESAEELAQGRWVVVRALHRWSSQEGFTTSIEGFRASG